MGAPMGAGWYPDPTTGQQRYFDGQQWGPLAPGEPAPTPPPKKPASLVKILGVIGGCAIVATVLANVGGDETPSSTFVPSTPSTPTYTAQDYEAGAVRTCQKAIKQGLKDPESAQFGEDWKAWQIRSASTPEGLAYDPAAGDKYFNASGGVNAKNSFGGYVGNETMYCEVVISAAGDINAKAHSAKDLLTPPTP